MDGKLKMVTKIQISLIYGPLCKVAFEVGTNRQIPQFKIPNITCYCAIMITNQKHSYLKKTIAAIHHDASELMHNSTPASSELLVYWYNCITISLNQYTILGLTISLHHSIKQ